MTTFIKKTMTVSVLIFFITGSYFIIHFTKAQAAIIVNGKTYNTVSEALEFVSSSDRGTFKGEQLSKIKTVSKVQRSKYFIEVVDMKPYLNGVEVFARAWYPNGTQIGFGEDGTVDIERFVFINPPILVDDPNGTIVRTITDKSTGEVTQRNLREDLQEALLQSLERTISAKQQKYGPQYIIKGKIGNTTTIIWPQSGSGGGNTSVDGETGGANTTWTTVRNAIDAGTLTGGYASDTGTGASGPQVDEKDSEGGYLIYRILILFDASSISSSDAVSSATLTLTSRGAKANGDSTTFNVSSGENIGSNAVVATTDFDAYTTLTPSASQIFYSDTISNWNDTVGADNDLLFDSDGVTFVNTAIDGDGIVKLMMRLGLDTGNIAPSNETLNYIVFYFADDGGAGTTNDPTLVIEHSSIVISNVSVSEVAGSSATINWTTNITGDSEVRYGTTTPVANSNPLLNESTSATTTSHSLTLSNLYADTTYYFIASSTSDAGVLATSTEGTFTTISGSTLFAHKPQDQATSSQSTLFVDDDLSIALTASTTYVVTAAITASSTATQPDINMAFNTPNGASMALTFGSFDGSSQVAGSGLFSSSSSEVSIDLPATGVVVVHINGIITTAETAGNVEFKWAQKTSNATPIKVFKGSYLRAEEITQ